MLSISYPSGIVEARVEGTASKSISNRLLIINALSKGKIDIQNLSDSSDSQTLIQALSLISKNGKITVDVSDAGTSFRFLTALLSLTEGEFLLTGSSRMKQRPVGILVDALQQLGADIQFAEQLGFPPLLIKGKSLSGGKILIESNQSSQYISALMMIGVNMANGLEIELSDQIVSKPYLQMTSSLMERCGAKVEWDGSKIKIHPGEYRSTSIRVENDWSSASYWCAIAALSEEADLFLKGLSGDSIQGDAIIVDLMKTFGVETTFSNEGVRLTSTFVKQPEHFSFDFTDYPDLAMTVAAVCVAKRIPATLSGLKNLVIKESDRLQSMKLELEKMNCHIEINTDSLIITPTGFVAKEIIQFKTHGDHRMAMSLAPLALTGIQVQLDNETVVTKSYPSFWEELTSAGFILNKS